MERSTSPWTSWKGLLILLVGFVLLYSRSLGFDYVFDDVSAVKENPAFEKPLSEALLMTQHEHHQSVRSEGRFTSHDSFRPLRHLSLWIDITLVGRKNAAAFHAHNVLVGGIAIWLVWLFLGHFPLSPLARLAATGAFAFHPAQVESVAYISGRSDVEAAIFALLTLLLGYRFLAASSLRERILPLIGSALAFLLCLAQKESFVLLPALALYPPRRASSRRLSLALGWLAITATMAVTWFALRSSVISGAVPLDLSGALAAAGRGLRQAFLVVLLPFGSSPVRPLAGGQPWVETILYGLGGVAGGIGALSSKKTAVRTVCFGMTWFALLIGPSLAAAFLFDVFFDHYLYLPSLGIFIAAAAAVDGVGAFLVRGAPRATKRWVGTVVWLAVVFVELLWVGMTAIRIPAWENQRTLAELCVEAHPDVGRGWVWLAESMGENATCAQIVPYYRRAVAVDPDYAPAWNNLAVCALRSGSLAQGEGYAKKAIHLSNGTSLSGWYNYGLILEGLGKDVAACNAQKSLLTLAPNHAGGQAAKKRVCHE